MIQTEENKMKKILAILLSASLVMASVTGCSSQTGGNQVQSETEGQKAESQEAVPDTQSQTEAAEEEAVKEEPSPAADAGTSGAIKITDAVGREVVLDKPADKIVSGYYITTSMMIALGIEDKLVGIESKAASRPIYGLAAPELLNLPDVGTAREFNLEGCISLEPDLVVLPKRLSEQAETLSGMGIAALVVNPEDTDLLLQTISMIGQAAGAEEQAEKLISYYDTKLEELDKISGEKTEKPSVYIAGTSSVLTAATPAMYQNSVIETAGGVNAASDLTDKGWANISYDQLIAYNPDILVIIPEADFTKEDVMKDGQLAEINAVKNAQVYEMPEDFEAWDSPVPSGILGCMWLSSIINEDKYPFDTFAGEAADFYKEFYHTDIDTALITK